MCLCIGDLRDTAPFPLHRKNQVRSSIPHSVSLSFTCNFSRQNLSHPKSILLMGEKLPRNL